jgi:ABC-type nitrate/sulfonate/bicarbonate transport system substrate-binding protein
MKKGLILKVMFVTVLLALGVVVQSASAAQKEFGSLKYIINNISDIVVIDLAIEKGFFDEQGIKVETVGVAGGGSATIQAILTNNADIGNAAIPAYINAIRAGGKLEVIYGGVAMAHAKDPGYSLIVRDESNIKSAKDLIGKTVAMGARGAMWDYGTKEYLRKNGVSVDKVNILIVPPPQLEQVLRSKQVDVIMIGSPISDKILEGGETRRLASLYEILGPNSAGAGFGFIVKDKLIKNNPELVRRLVAVYEKTDQWATKNPDEARKLVARILKNRNQNPAIAKYWKAPYLRNYGLLQDSDIQFWLDWFIREGKLKVGELKPSDIYTNAFNPYYKKR